MEQEYPVNFFETNKTLLKIAGLWFPKKQDSLRLWIIYTIQTVVYVINCEFWFSFSEMSELRHTYKNKSTLVEHLGRVILHSLTSLKTFNFIFRRKRIFEIMETLESEEFRYKATTNFKPGVYFHESKNFLCKMSWSYIFFTTLVPISYYCTTFFQFLNNYTPEQFIEGNVTCKSFLPYHSLPPFYTRTKTSCAFGIGYQFVSVMWYSWQIAANDTLFAAILVYIKTHFISVREAFDSIKLRSEMEVGGTKGDKVKDETNSKVIQQMDKEMIKSSKHLETIIVVCESTEDIYNIVALGQTLNTLFTLVSCLFLLSTWSIISIRFLSQFLYIFGLLYQLFLYCWFGNEVMLAGLTIPDYIYRSKWIVASQSFKRMMLINMIRLQRPIVFTAGKFTTLTLTTLVTIIRGSYSYFAVLKNMDAAASET